MEEEIKNKIISLKEEGKSIRVIAEELNINRGSVDYVIKNYDKNKITMTDNKKTTMTTMTEQDNYDKITMTAKEESTQDNKTDNKENKKPLSIGEDIFIF